MDLRPEQDRDIPEACPECGAAISRHRTQAALNPKRAESHRRQAEQHGFFGDDPVKVVFWYWHCSAESDPHHYWGPKAR